MTTDLTNNSIVSPIPICDEVMEILQEFQLREMEYIYSPNEKRKLFTLEQADEFRHRSTLSLDEFIEQHNLQDQYNKRELRKSFTNKQEREFENSNLSLDEFIDKYNINLSYCTLFFFLS